MMRFSTLLTAVSAAALMTFSVGEAQAAPRYAVVNVGPSDYDTAQRLLSLYGALTPAPKAVPAKAPKKRAAPARAAARPSATRARPATRPRAAKLSAPIRGSALRKALVGLPHDEAVAMAAAAVAKGKRLYSTLKRTRAADAFSRAITYYDGHVAWSRARPALLEAHTYLLLCYHSLGLKKQARAVSARLRELTGNKPPKGVPAATWASYPLEPLPLGPRRKLTVKAPAGARVWLDDRAAGTGPLELTAGPGPHRVRVELTGHRVFLSAVAAGTAASTVLVTLVPRSTDAFGDIRRDLRKVSKSADRWKVGPLKALAKRLVLDHLLVCVMEGGSLKARWFSRRLGKWASAEMSLPKPGPKLSPTAVMAAFGKLRVAERKRAQALAEADKDKGSKRKVSSPKLWKKWYFWVAAAVVAGVVAAFAIKDGVTDETVILRVTRP